MAGPEFPSLLRRRWLWALAGSLFVVPLLVLAWIYWWLLPNLPQYKDDIVGLLSSATGYTITLENMDGEWGGARPRFALEGVEISEGGKRLLYFSKLEGSFGWRTLLALEPRFHELRMEAPGLTVRRTRDGLIQVGGFKIDPNDPDTSFSDWLLRQGALRMDGATLAWIDDTRDSPPLVLRNVSIEMQTLLNRHAVRVEFSPPTHLARPVTLSGVLYGNSLSRLEDWRGNVVLNMPALEMAAWRPWLPVAYEQIRGHGSVELEADVAKGNLAEVSLKANLADVYFQGLDLAAPLDLSRLTGQLGWMHKPSSKGARGQTVYARRLLLRDRAGASAGPFDLAYRWGREEQQITAADLSLGEIVKLKDGLPIEASLKDRLSRLALVGRFDSLDLTWEGQVQTSEKFSVNAQFNDLGWAAEGNVPGAANLSGMMVGNEEKGTYSISGKNAGFDIPRHFAEPQLRFDTLNIRGGWDRDNGKRYTLEIAEMVLSNADFAASCYGSFSIGGSEMPFADLTGKVDRAQGPRVERYLPFEISEDTRAWLRDSVLRGEVRQGTFKLQGDLAKFPFASKQDGTFRVAGKISGGQLRYAHDYPQIEDIEGDLVFDGIRMEIQSDKARIYAAQLRRVKAVIPDLVTTEELLEISGEAVGPAQEFIRFANFSPVGDLIGNLTDEMTANGNMRLQLNLKIPLRQNHLTTLAGRLNFDRNTLFPGPDLPRMENVTGSLDFTGNSVDSKRINARILGGPAEISVVTAGGVVKVLSRGTFTASALETWLGQGIAGRLSGQADWQGSLRLEHTRPRLRLESNLIGLHAGLPAPLDKTADKGAFLIFEQKGLEDGTRWSGLQYGNIASAVWVSTQTPSGFRLQRGEFNFGGIAQLPSEPGLLIAGAVKSIDLGGWADILPQGPGGRGTAVSGINLKLGSVEFLGRQFHDIDIKGKLKDNLLRASVTGREMDGTLVYRRATEENVSRISGQFKQFHLPDPLPYAQATGQSAMRLEASDMPALDLQIDDLKLGSHSLGRLEVVAHGVPSGLAIDQLNLLHADTQIRMNGLWKDTGIGETRMNMNVEIKDIGKMLGRFGYANAVRKGSANIEGEVTWPRSPADFTFEKLDGTLKLNARNGQFLKIDAGAGKLLGIASLQSLPRRVTLDFRDVFSDGFAFDEISSTIQMSDGDLYTNDFLMRGPAATVKMSGKAGLRDEKVKLRVKVSPKLSESVAVAGALLGGPIAGVGALVAQKLLKDPIEEAISYEYMVDGPWAEPTVTKLARPKTQEKEPDS